MGPSTIHSVKDVSSKVDSVIKNNILFIHAWSGCDTTSSTVGHGKTKLMKALAKDRSIQEIAEHFCSADTQDAVGELGIDLFTLLFLANISPPALHHLFNTNCKIKVVPIISRLEKASVSFCFCYLLFKERAMKF